MYDVPQKLPIVGDFEASLKKYPPVKLGTPDPYTPPASQ